MIEYRRSQTTETAPPPTGTSTERSALRGGCRRTANTAAAPLCAERESAMVAPPTVATMRPPPCWPAPALAWARDRAAAAATHALRGGGLAAPVTAATAAPTTRAANTSGNRQSAAAPISQLVGEPP